ncbi:MAG: hypothetical protein ABI164_02480 [Acidobacteriaceae bacterium]
MPTSRPVSDVSLHSFHQKRRHCVRSGVPLRQLTAASQESARDFADDVVAADRTIRKLRVIDAFTRECLALELDTGFASGYPLRQRPGVDQPHFLAWGLE